MLLAVDVGNTHTVVGGYQGAELQFSWRIATNKKETEDEIRSKLVSMFLAEGVQPAAVDGVSLASVVPLLTMAWKRAAKALFGVEPFVCSAESAGVLFRTTYPNPAEIGSDRVADALGAVARYGAPVTVIDLGTATNIEVIDNEGRFVGGIIAPGVEISSQALFQYCSKLSAIDLVAPSTPIGFSTEQAMQAGIVLGEAGRIDGLVRRIFAYLGYETRVVATGGLAGVISPYCETVTDIDSNLTLEGLRLAYQAAQR